MSEQDFQVGLDQTEIAKQAAEVSRLQAERSARIAAAAVIVVEEPVTIVEAPDVIEETVEIIETPINIEVVEETVTFTSTATPTITPEVIQPTIESSITPTVEQPALFAGGSPDEPITFNRSALQQVRIETIDNASNQIETILSNAGFDSQENFNASLILLKTRGTELGSFSANLADKSNTFSNDIKSFESSINQLQEDINTSPIITAQLQERINLIETQRSGLDTRQSELILEQEDLNNNIGVFLEDQSRISDIIAQINPLAKKIQLETIQFNKTAGSADKERKFINEGIATKNAEIALQNIALRDQENTIRDIINSLNITQQSFIEVGSEEAATGITSTLAVAERIKEELAQKSQIIQDVESIPSVVITPKGVSRSLTSGEIRELAERELGISEKVFETLGIAEEIKPLTGLSAASLFSAISPEEEREIGIDLGIAKRLVFLAKEPIFTTIDIIDPNAIGTLELGEEFSGKVGEKEVAIIQQPLGKPPLVVDPSTIRNVGTESDPKFAVVVSSFQTAELTQDQKKVQQQINRSTFIAPIIFVVEKAQAFSEIASGTVLATASVTTQSIPGLKDIDAFEDFRQNFNTARLTAKYAETPKSNNPLSIFSDIRDAYDQTDLPFGVKFALETLLDPLILIPIGGVALKGSRLGIKGALRATGVGITKTGSLTKQGVINFVKAHTVETLVPKSKLTSITREALETQLISVKSNISALKSGLSSQGFSPILVGQAGAKHPLELAEDALIAKLNRVVIRPSLNEFPEIQMIKRVTSSLSDILKQASEDVIKVLKDGNVPLTKTTEIFDPTSLNKFRDLPSNTKAKLTSIVQALNDKLTIPIVRDKIVTIGSGRLATLESRPFIVGAIHFSDNPNAYIVEAARLADKGLLRPTAQATFNAIKAAPIKSVNIGKKIGNAAIDLIPIVRPTIETIGRASVATGKGIRTIGLETARSIRTQRIPPLRPQSLIVDTRSLENVSINALDDTLKLAGRDALSQEFSTKASAHIANLVEAGSVDTRLLSDFTRKLVDDVILERQNFRALQETVSTFGFRATPELREAIQSLSKPVASLVDKTFGRFARLVERLDVATNVREATNNLATIDKRIRDLSQGSPTSERTLRLLELIKLEDQLLAKFSSRFGNFARDKVLTDIEKINKFPRISRTNLKNRVDDIFPENKIAIKEIIESLNIDDLPSIRTRPSVSTSGPKGGVATATRVSAKLRRTPTKVRQDVLIGRGIKDIISEIPKKKTIKKAPAKKALIPIGPIIDSLGLDEPSIEERAIPIIESTLLEARDISSISTLISPREEQIGIITQSPSIETVPKRSSLIKSKPKVKTVKITRPIEEIQSFREIQPFKFVRPTGELQQIGIGVQAQPQLQPQPLAIPSLRPVIGVGPSITFETVQKTELAATPFIEEIPEISPATVVLSEPLPDPDKIPKVKLPKVKLPKVATEKALSIIIPRSEEKDSRIKRTASSLNLRLIRRSRFGDSTWTLFRLKGQTAILVQSFGPFKDSDVIASNIITRSGKTFLKTQFKQDDKTTKGIDLALALLANGQLQFNEISNLLPWELKVPKRFINV